MTNIKEKRNRKQFARPGNEAVNFQIDHKINFFLPQFEHGRPYIFSNEISKSSNNKFIWEIEVKKYIYANFLYCFFGHLKSLYVL